MHDPHLRWGLGFYHLKRLCCEETPTEKVSLTYDRECQAIQCLLSLGARHMLHNYLLVGGSLLIEIPIPLSWFLDEYVKIRDLLKLEICVLKALDKI